MYNNQAISGLRLSRDNWFTCVDTAVIIDPDLSPNAKTVYMVLCEIAGYGYRSADLDDQEVSRLSNISVRTTRRAYKELEAKGIIAIDRKEYFVELIGHNAPRYAELEDYDPYEEADAQ